MRTLSLLGLLATANFVTAGLGLPLGGEGGKLSISNIMPVIFAVAGLLAFIRSGGRIRKDILWFLLLFNAASLASFLIFLFRYGWQPNFAVLLFQDAELVFCLLLVWYGRNHASEFRAVVKAGIFGSAVVMVSYGWAEFNDGALYSAFGMDDKSQAAALLCCEAYILIRFFGGSVCTLLGLGLLLLSFMTISRLPVFFAPAIVLALLHRSRYGLVLGAALGASIVTLIVVAGDAIAAVFLVLDRLASLDAIAGSASTSAHLQLLVTAWELKFWDGWAAVFGIGPGNFSKALITSPEATAAIGAVDPNLVAVARAGRAPLHSTVMQILLDYNILIFLLFAFLMLRITRFLVRTRNFAELAFLAGVFAASTFYSLHNKPYYFLLITTVALLSLQSRTEPDRQAEGLDDNRFASDPPVRPV